ncbi:DinB family protein [Brevibacillus sp. B_LB10_24]|uniref:DinB family protein n=1 Tax=Brevibacillus sp. B_LB10_24 TaxID=3380645 RepID=UPI0038B7D48D
MSQTILNTARNVRQITLKQVQAIPEELFDVQPQAFNNTIRWNVGHMLVTVDFFLSLGFPFSSDLPETYKGLFNTGTKPANWTDEPPTKEELVQYLSEQLERFSAVSPDMLDQPLKSPIEMGALRFETAGEVFNFAFVHEAMHLSTISSLLKVIQSQPSS